MLSPQLAAALTTAVEAGEKAILFLNRRGFASYLACDHCGHGWECPTATCTLALFAGGGGCAAAPAATRAAAPAVCPECGSAELVRYGFGTEALEREVASLLPGVELLRLDSDVASSVARLRGVLDRFAAPGAKVLVGTQMIAKGHHFPEVTLVGVVNADLTLRFPDFSAEERTFAMLVQVAGRSGRGERPGRVLVQTLDPEARPIAAAASGEHEPFYADEIERRAALSYPPAGVLIGVEVSSPDASKAAAGADFVRDKLAAAVPAGDLVLGPGPLGRERSRHRRPAGRENPGRGEDCACRARPPRPLRRRGSRPGAPASSSTSSRSGSEPAPGESRAAAAQGRRVWRRTQQAATMDER